MKEASGSVPYGLLALIAFAALIIAFLVWKLRQSRNKGSASQTLSGQHSSRKGSRTMTEPHDPTQPTAPATSGVPGAVNVVVAPPPQQRRSLASILGVVVLAGVILAIAGVVVSKYFINTTEKVEAKKEADRKAIIEACRKCDPQGDLKKTWELNELKLEGLSCEHCPVSCTPRCDFNVTGGQMVEITTCACVPTDTHGT